MTPPRWPTQSKKEAEQVRDWACAQLDLLLAGDRPPPHWLVRKTLAFRSAENGEYGPLRKEYPHLAPYLNPPEPRKKKRKSKRPTVPSGETEGARAIQAANLIPHVQKLWEKHFGKRNKRGGYGPSALEIAAHYKGVPATAVERAMHNRGRSVEKSFLRK